VAQFFDVSGECSKALAADHRPVNHGQVQLVLHQSLCGQTLDVAVVQRLIEALTEPCARLQWPAATHIVRPESDVLEIGGAQALQQVVEGLVPVLKLPVFPAHKRESTEQPGDQVVAFTRFHHVRVHVRAERDEVAEVGVRREQRHGWSPGCGSLKRRAQDWSYPRMRVARLR
jgi:hypothetical protein